MCCVFCEAPYCTYCSLLTFNCFIKRKEESAFYLIHKWLWLLLLILPGCASFPFPLFSFPSCLQWKNNSSKYCQNVNMAKCNIQIEAASNLLIKVWQNSIMMKYCSAAWRPWPTNLVLQMWGNLFCTDIIMIIIVLCKNENCVPTKRILNNLQSFYNHNICQNNVVVFIYIYILCCSWHNC